MWVFSARTPAGFDVTFQPFFAKRVFIEREKGENNDEGNYDGRIDFRKLFPKNP
jgi:hypothetical protein